MAQFLAKKATNVLFKLARNHLTSLESSEAYLLRGQKFFSMNFDEFLDEFSQLKWITYSDNFNPLLIEIGKWNEKAVDHLTTDN